MDLNRGRRPVEDLWLRTLSQIPTVYGRLVYLSSLRDPNSGLYRHHGLAMVFSPEAAHEALEESHLSSFREWLALSLEHQKADLDLYMSDQPTDRRTLVENWIRLAPYRGLMPAAVTKPEEELFMADVEALLKVLKNELEGGGRDRSY
jgi:hypothetical protein